jgi:hypothetical protein
MKKIVLSTLAALSIATVASADALYQDANGQVFTKPADDRTLINSTNVNSMTDRLDFSMLAYLGYYNQDFRESTSANVDKNDFEARRMYFQVKAYLDGSKKDYFRLTYDAFSSSKTGSGDYYNAAVKYAYLYLDNILPFTSVEIGQAHTTLLDYEETNSWKYRSIDNVFTEEGNGPKVYASAGRGFDLKTNTKYISSELGIYNNNGYHDTENVYGNNGMGMDYEGRVTLHTLGTGTDYKQAHTYWDVSLLGKHAVLGAKTTASGTPMNADLDAVGVHSVFNTKPLLVAAQYWNIVDTSPAAGVTANAGSGYSVNFDARLGETDQYHVFGRIDNFTQKSTVADYQKRTYIAGAAWDMNKNVQWQANVITYDNQHNSGNTSTSDNYNKYMLTAQVQF